MSHLKRIAKPFAMLSSQATRRAIKQFANKFNFVYFGAVDPREDEYEMVRGLTASTTHIDSHYSVGTYNGHDAILVERRNTLNFPGRPTSHYRWLIMQVEVAHINLPHIFIDCHHHDAVFYANALLSKNGLQDMSGYFSNVSASFSANCRLFASPSAYVQVSQLITPEIAETLAQHFSRFDYEFSNDTILVYASNPTATPQLTEDMLRIGTWLAEQFGATDI